MKAKQITARDVIVAIAKARGLGEKNKARALARKYLQDNP